MILVRRLVPYLVDHIRNALVLVGHICEELHSRIRMKSMRMPVHKHINTVFDSRIHDRAGAFLAEIRILEVALCLTFLIVDLDSDGRTHKFRIPVLDNMPYGTGVIETRPEHIPSEAHALKFNRITRFIHQGRTLNMKTLHLRDLTAACRQHDGRHRHKESFSHDE